MKAIKIGNKIKQYGTIPKSWNNVIGGFHLMSTAEHQAAGFYDVVIPEYNSATQNTTNLIWNNSAKVLTYSVVNKTWSETVAELKAEKIEELKNIYNRKLVQTDWYIIRAQEGTDAPQSIIDSRSGLRTECATKEGEISALTTKASIASYSLPNLN
jgi:hypothetical protein